MNVKAGVNQLGSYISLIMTLLAIVTFGIAICTPPVSGPYCKGSCIGYPYTDIISRFPGDYLWMYPAILLAGIFIAFMVCIHQYSTDNKKIFSLLGLSFSIVSASAIIYAVERLPVGEKFIIADDTPVTQKEYSIYLSELMHKNKPGHIPAFLIRFILGRDFYEVIRINCKVSNSKAKKILNWQPQYPSCKEGLEATILEIKRNGLLD